MKIKVNLKWVFLKNLSKEQLKENLKLLIVVVIKNLKEIKNDMIFEYIYNCKYIIYQKNI